LCAEDGCVSELVYRHSFDNSLDRILTTGLTDGTSGLDMLGKDEDFKAAGL